MRWLFNSPFPALNEVVAMLFAVAISATVPAGLANKVNLRIDLLSRFMTPRLGMWLDSVGSLLLLTFFGLLTWQIYVYAGQLAEQGRGTVMLGPAAGAVHLRRGGAAHARLPRAGDRGGRTISARSPPSRARSRARRRTRIFTKITIATGIVVIALAIYVAINLPRRVELGAAPYRARGAVRLPLPVAVHARAGAAGRRDGARRAWSARR